jgi:hypothetical protein
MPQHCKHRPLEQKIPSGVWFTMLDWLLLINWMALLDESHSNNGSLLYSYW